MQTFICFQKINNSFENHTLYFCIIKQIKEIFGKSLFQSYYTYIVISKYLCLKKYTFLHTIFQKNHMIDTNNIKIY